MAVRQNNMNQLADKHLPALDSRYTYTLLAFYLISNTSLRSLRADLIR
jgi:hypothetical protein